MHRRIKQLQRLAPWEQWMLLKLLVLLPAIGAALRLLDFHATFGLIARSVPEAEARAGCGEECPGEDIAHRIGRLVSIAANHGPYRATCLRQSLALWWLLRRRRIPAELRIGVRKDNAGLRAHAWVELDGRALNDPSGVCRTYAPFPRSSAVGALPLP